MYPGRPTGPGGLPPNMPPSQGSGGPPPGGPPGGQGNLPPIQNPLGLGFGTGVLSQTLQGYGGKSQLLTLTTLKLIYKFFSLLNLIK